MFYHSYSADIPTSARPSATAPRTPIPLLLSQISPHSPASSMGDSHLLALLVNKKFC